MGLAVLTLPQRQCRRRTTSSPRTSNRVTFFLPGAFTKTGGGGVAANTLIKSTTGAGFVDSMLASQLDPSLTPPSARPAPPTISSPIYQAPSRPPSPMANPARAPKEEDKPKDGRRRREGRREKEDRNPNGSRKAASPGNVFLIADVDAFYDRFAYNVQNFGGMQMASPANGNASLLFNLLDQAVGSKHLIGSRSRSADPPPVHRGAEMEAEFNKQVGTKIEEFQEKQSAAQQKLSDLQAQKSRGSELYLSPEQEAEIRKLRKEQVEYSKLIREQEKDLRRQKDKLAGKITLLNVAVMPAVVILFGLGLFLQRRRSTRAR
jgi:ABC-type uncharacterized transport system involved in gliding motility auxiliary subunit